MHPRADPDRFKPRVLPEFWIRPRIVADYLLRDARVTDLLPVMLLAAGFGLALPVLTTPGISAAGAGDAGLVSGLFSTTQQIGMALGVAVLSTLAATRGAGLAARGHGRAEALTGGYHLAFGIGTGLVLAASALAA